LENWQVAQQLGGGPRTPLRAAEPRGDQRGPGAGQQGVPPRPQSVAPGLREDRRCYTCGQTGHLARQCTGNRDVSMPSAFADGGQPGPCLLTDCWAHQTSGAPTIPVRVGKKDTEALLDTGSVVTLLRPDLEGGRRGEPIEVACVHGDTRTYDTCHVVVRTPRGVYVTRAGIVPHLPVPMLIGRDCPLLTRLLNPGPSSRLRRDPSRRSGCSIRCTRTNRGACSGAGRWRCSRRGRDPRCGPTATGRPRERLQSSGSTRQPCSRIACAILH
jgi:hypothetical protein